MKLSQATGFPFRFMVQSLYGPAEDVVSAAATIAFSGKHLTTRIKQFELKKIAKQENG